MRILGIETSCVRGSVALVEAGQTLAVAAHERENAHEQTILPLVEQVLAAAGWAARSLDLVAVGIGPGSFTGLRVGIALAQGISEGLEVPLVGVSSLEAMAAAAPQHLAGARVPVLDARRGELFLAAHGADGRQLLAPQIVQSQESARLLASTLGGDALLLGRDWSPEIAGRQHHRSEESDLPHARWVALLAAQRPRGLPVVPLYLRPPTATVPQLSPNPLGASGGAPALHAQPTDRQG